jgi:hypothetical protein
MGLGDQGPEEKKRGKVGRNKKSLKRNKKPT